MKPIPAILILCVGIAAAATWLRWLPIRSVIEHNSEASVIATSAILAALVAIWGIISQRAITRRQVTYEQIVHYLTDKDVISARRNFIKLAKAPDGIVSFAQSDQETSTDTQDIISTLNFFELFSIGIQKGIIDHDLFKQWNRSSVIIYWNYAHPFVNAIRSRMGNDLIFHEFEQMANWFKSDTTPKNADGGLAGFFRAARKGVLSLAVAAARRP